MARVTSPDASPPLVWAAGSEIDLFATLLGIEARGLDRVDADRAGVYALFHDPGARPSLYAALDGWPIYVGSTKNLRDRMSRHMRTLHATKDLKLSDFTVRTLACSTLARARFAEASLQYALGNVVWNQCWVSGFGSRVPGQTRRGRRARWDQLHPGRGYWTAASPPDAGQRRALRAKVRRYLLDEGRPRAHWTTLTPDELMRWLRSAERAAA